MICWKANIFQAFRSVGIADAADAQDGQQEERRDQRARSEMKVIGGIDSSAILVSG